MPKERSWDRAAIVWGLLTLYALWMGLPGWLIALCAFGCGVRLMRPP